MQPDRPHQQVVVEGLRAEDFRQTPQRPPPQIVHLKQPVLGHGVAVPHKEVGLRLGIDVRQAAGVPLNLNRRADRARRPPVDHRQPTPQFPAPPRLKVRVAQSSGGADVLNRVALTQLVQDPARVDSHDVYSQA